jgi:FkbM family methyltransferase
MLLAGSPHERASAACRENVQMPRHEEKLRTKLRRYGREFGIDVRRVGRFFDESTVLAHFLEERNIPLVIDVGANIGQFASNLFRAGYSGRILSFEPFPDARDELLRTSSSNSRWDVGPPVALGDKSAVGVLHIAGNSISSSLLPMESLHVNAAPQSAEVGTISVDVRRLDDILTSLGVAEERFFLKLDTQGTEKAIVEGSSALLHRITGIKIELSLVPLYVGQPLFDEVYQFITARGFEIWDMTTGFRDNRTGRLLQSDFVFFRGDE